MLFKSFDIVDGVLKARELYKIFIEQADKYNLKKKKNPRLFGYNFAFAV